MRIAIDASILENPEYRGIARMLWNMIHEWKTSHPEHEYYLMSRTELRLPDTLPANWHNCVVPGRVHAVWRCFPLQRKLRELSPDVFWGPNFYLPPRIPGCRYVVTIHDFAWKLFPGSSTLSTRMMLGLFGPPSGGRADCVVTDSEATARDAIRLWDIPEKKVRTCYCVLPGATSEKPDSVITDGSYFRLQEPYLLFLSTIEPRKNPVTILHAFERYIDDTGSDLSLVFAGASGWRMKKFREALKHNRYRDRIQFTGYVSELQKESLLRHAVALLYPSLYEGFGIPILEAFAAGIPVITTRCSSMPEVGGKAAFYVENPLSVTELAECIQTVCGLSADERTHRIAEGTQQLALFTNGRQSEAMMGFLAGTDAL